MTEPAPLVRARAWDLARRFGGWAVFFASLAILYGPALFRHAKLAANPWIFNDDARAQIFAFYRYSDPRPFADDYLGDYALDTLGTLGFRALYWLAAVVWDPAPVSEALAYPLLLWTAVAIGITAHRFGGKVAAWTAVALCLGSQHYLYRLGGGLPRGFAYPIFASGLAALALGRMRAAAAFVVLGAAFYPPVPMPLGIALAIVLLVLPARDRGDAARWSRRRRWAALAVTGALAAGLVVPVLLAARPYGPTITPKDVPAYPEAAPGGAHGPEDLPPFPGFFAGSRLEADRALFAEGEGFAPPLRNLVDLDRTIFWDLIIFALLVGWARLASDAAARRVLAFGAAVLASHAIARAGVPYFHAPTRYILYTVPILLAVMIPPSFYALWSLAPARWRGPWRDHAVAGTLCLLFFFAVGGRPNTWAGLTVEVHEPEQSLFKALAQLPPETLIAAFPEEPMSNISYVARRKTFVSLELHLAYHKKHLDEMRTRMRALFAAYFATSPGPLAELRERHHVTHLVVRLPHLEGRAPGYFEPMNSWIREAVQAARGKRYEVLRQIDRAAVIRVPPYVVLDLSKIDESEP